MKRVKEKAIYKRITLALSLCLLLVWGLLGTGASVAWFADTSPEVNNIFHFADFDPMVSYRLDDGSWDEVDSTTKLFDDEALYEPGYVQTVYLKVLNNGDRDFDFYTAVNVNGVIIGTNAFGHPIALQEYLKFGVITSNSEDDILARLADRRSAVEVADMPLHNYYETGTVRLAPDEECYLAVVVRMPEEVDNVANYRGDTPPEVELGITVKADQPRS